MKNLLATAFVLMSLVSQAQKDSSSPISFSGLVDVYYAYDFNNPSNHQRPDFIYSYNRHNDVAINLGLIKVAYAKDNVRANLGLMAGTYANANLANEPGVLKNIYEANAGVKISKTKNLWVDAGIFSSHIGWESAIGKDCWTLTRSIGADNSPYYETGAKISYTTNNGKWFLSGLLLNGWQHIQRPDGYNTPAFGYQITYKPNDKVLLNNSSFFGSDTPDSVKQMRYYEDFYGQFQMSDKWALTAGFDIGIQQKLKGSNSYNTWYTPVLIAKYAVNNKINVSARAEYYYDKNEVIIKTGTDNGFQTFGYSFNLDYNITNNVLWRVEYGMYNSKDKVFYANNENVNNNTHIITALSVAL